ncbi:hypothetical protein COOONC_08803 [Cooperia oncophora]
MPYCRSQNYEKSLCHEVKNLLQMAEAEDSGGVGRLSRLEASYLDGPSKSSTALSFEALLDTLICLYDECCSSTLRKEKCVAEFVESGQSLLLYCSSSYFFSVFSSVISIFIVFIQVVPGRYMIQ